MGSAAAASGGLAARSPVETAGDDLAQTTRISWTPEPVRAQHPAPRTGSGPVVGPAPSPAVRMSTDAAGPQVAEHDRGLIEGLPGGAGMPGGPAPLRPAATGADRGRFAAGGVQPVGGVQYGPGFGPGSTAPQSDSQAGDRFGAGRSGGGYAPDSAPAPNSPAPQSNPQAPADRGAPRGGQWVQGPDGRQAFVPGPPQQPSLDDIPVRRAAKPVGSGWRKAVHHASGGTVNLGMSAEERRLQELVARIRQPVRGDYRIAVLSLKGGVGKTTTTMGLGSTFASIRGDRVIAVDANPDFGTLSQRVPLQTRSTVRDLLLDQHINAYSDVRRHTSQATSRLEVLASERDPAASESFSADEYREVARTLQKFYNIILTDCGTGLMHSAMSGVLDLSHSLVAISSSAIDGARSAAATLDWLSLHGHDHLVRNAVVVINLPRPGSPNVALQSLREYFLSRCRAVHVIPYDAHLSEGAEIDLARLAKPTKRAFVELAATVADDFGRDIHYGMR
ncbi:MinD/ParA family protein [Nocardia stercoris]|uniref:MinD/ParA family protein n=1 Tax=Nocardia stercoris TaxID=2483361 RepID=A0A3M2L5H5_9NOCA|nr:MinD/ParA family protein [Nocardia stercoris]RMI31970.1 MinD/ParA family protein [Nocardia stercoris]